MILNHNLEVRGIVIDPVPNFGKEKVSVDLSVGENYQRSGETDWLKVSDKIVIQPNSCIVIQTAESISMPNNIFGILTTKGSLGAKGIVSANTKLDPLFSGKLSIPVFNVSSRRVELNKGDSFCSMSFWETESPIIGEARNAIKLHVRSEKQALEWISNNTPHIVSGGLSLIGAIIAAIITVSLGG